MSKYKDDSCPAKFVRSHLQLLHNLRFILFIDKLVRSVPIIILRANNVMDTTNHRRSAHHSDQSCNTFLIIIIIIITGVWFYSYFKEKKIMKIWLLRKKSRNFSHRNMQTMLDHSEDSPTSHHELSSRSWELFNNQTLQFSVENIGKCWY